MSEAQTQETYSLPFYLVRTGLANWRIFKPSLDDRFSTLLDKEKSKTLALDHPRHATLGIGNVAAVHTDREMIEGALWAVTNSEGVLATADPELAAYALQVSSQINPKACLDPYSKKLTESQKAGPTIPGPRKYAIKPKDQFKTK